MNLYYLYGQEGRAAGAYNYGGTINPTTMVCTQVSLVCYYGAKGVNSHTNMLGWSEQGVNT